MKTVLTLALAAVVLIAAAPHKPQGPLRFGIDVQGKQINGPSPTDCDDPASLKVGEPTVRVDDQRITAELIVSNPTAKPLRVLVNPYGGGFPYGGSTPFLVRFPYDQKVVTYTGPQFPPPSPPFPPAAYRTPARTPNLYQSSGFVLGV